MKTILILCNNYYPDSIIGAKRMSVFSYYLSEKYNIIVVRSGEIIGSPSLSLGLHERNNLKIFSYNGNSSDCDKIERGELISSTKALRYKRPTRFRVLFSRLFKPIKYYLNERKVFKKTMAVAEKLLLENNIDLIITTYAPLGSTMAGYHLKKKHNLKWIMDIRDLMDIPSRGIIIRFFNSKIQKKLCNYCDAITTPTYGFKKELIEKTKTKKPIHVLYNGFFETEDSTKKQNKNKLTFCYTGTIHDDLCTLQPFAKSLLDLIMTKKIDPSRIKIIYSGVNSDLFLEQINCIVNHVEVENTGYLNSDKIRKIQLQSDVFLLMVMNCKKYTGVLTGKMAEGVWCKAPLIGLVFGDLQNSELFQTINDYSLGFCYEDCNRNESFGKMKEYILTLYQRKFYSEEKDVSIEIPEEVTRKFNYKYICEQLEEDIDELLL